MPPLPQLTLRERRNLRAHVLDELIRIDESIDALTAGLLDLDVEIAALAGQLPAPGNATALGKERDLVVGLLRDARAERAEMRATQDRIEAADFGFCDRCHEFIGLDRLLALATTTRCVRCAN